MAASWPSAKKTFSQVVNGVTKLVALLFNANYNETEALQTFIGASGETQAKNAALMNMLRYKAKLPTVTWIDADTVEISAGSVTMFNGNDYVIKYNSSAIQITLSSDLDTGAEASSTLYDICLIGDGASTTFTAQFVLTGNNPSGATYFKRLPVSVRNDGSSDILKFYQDGDWVTYDALVTLLDNGTATTWTDVLCRGYVPAYSTLIQVHTKSGTTAGFLRPKSSSWGSTSDVGSLWTNSGDSHIVLIHTDSSGYIQYVQQATADAQDIQLISYYTGGLQ